MYYAHVGMAGFRSKPKTGLIEMQGPPPSGVAVAQADGTWKEPELSVTEKRKKAILEAWPVHMQLEALTEAAENPARSVKLESLLKDIQKVKNKFPKDV